MIQFNQNDTALNPNFNALGYTVTNSFKNLGSSAFYLFIAAFLLIIITIFSFICEKMDK